MEVIYLRKFQKDLQSVPIAAKEQVKNVITHCKTAAQLKEIVSLKN
jgi:hypothetical protein